MMHLTWNFHPLKVSSFYTSGKCRHEFSYKGLDLHSASCYCNANTLYTHFSVLLYVQTSKLRVFPITKRGVELQRE